jgi:hypothetical protein
MSTLSILQWSGVKREVHFVGYNRDHTACFIRDEQNSRRAITLHLPKTFDLHFYQNPIGKDGSPLVKINRAVLHVPACFGTKKEKQAFDNPQSAVALGDVALVHDLWMTLTPHKCWLDPKDDPKLSKLLHAELDRQRRFYKIRVKETEDQIAALPPSETKQAEELRNMLQGEFTAVTVGENNEYKYISIFEVTLDMVRHGWAGLREKLLEREWAEHFGVNLETISTEAAAFHVWLGNSAYNASQTTTNLNTRAVEIGFGLKLDPWQWEVLKAAVLYEIRFADGSRCWLDEIEERGITDPQEVEDFDRLEQASEVAGDERMSLDEVCRHLPVKWKGELKPMGKKGLQKLCKNARVIFRFPMRRTFVRKLDEYRKRQQRKRTERLKRHIAKKRAKEAR